jgi:hypothetical protein
VVDDRGIARRPEQYKGQRPFDIGVLFVHGIGAQRRRETLRAFAEPIFSWLRARFKGLDHRWREAIGREAINDQEKETLKLWRAELEDWADSKFPPDGQPAKPDARQLEQLANGVGSKILVGRVDWDDTLIDDPNDETAPEHTELLFQRYVIAGDVDEERVEEERWLLAESWWAEAFSQPSFREVADWGLLIVPWAVGSHFGELVQRIWAKHPQEVSWKQTLSWMVWLWRALTALLWLILGLLATLVLLAAIVVLFLAFLLPDPWREKLLELQLWISSRIGDSYMLVSPSHSGEAFDIVKKVRRDIKWLAQRCRVIAVVAHSQGAAVAHKALRDENKMPDRLRLLFTFGSGLKKLEQLKHASKNRSYVNAAVGTHIALLIVVLFIIGLFLEQGYGITLTVGAVVALLVLVAGLFDLVRKIQLNDLDKWIKKLTKKRTIEWVDCYAAADPVSSGLLLDQPEVDEKSREVCNLSSILRDHTTYWDNRDQFVTLLIHELTQSSKLRKDSGLCETPELKIKDFDLVKRRRHWRVSILRAIRVAGLLSVLFAFYQEFPAWRSFVTDWASLVPARVTALPGGSSVLVVEGTGLWRALLLLMLALGIYWLASLCWRVWNETEMGASIDGLEGERQVSVRALFTPNPSTFSVWGCVYLQIMIAIWLLYRDSLLILPDWALWVVPLLLLCAQWTELTRSLAHRRSKHRETPLIMERLYLALGSVFIVLLMVSSIAVFGFQVWLASAWLAQWSVDDLIPGSPWGQITLLEIVVLCLESLMIVGGWP